MHRPSLGMLRSPPAPYDESMQSGSTLILCVGFSGNVGISRERALSCAGFRVSSITSPFRAITSARQNDPKVVIVDDDSIEDWRELADCLVIASPQVKVVVLVSTPERPSTSVAALLSKPISPEGLLQAVQAVLRENVSAAKSGLKSGNELAANPQN